METALAHYTCYRTAGPIQIDGKLDEPSWRMAPKSEPFVDIVTGEPAWFDTRVAMLWDDECLYFGFTAEEPEVRGYLTERDSRIYEDNDVEVFIAGQNAYYEFEINALNTIYEVFWIWKDALVPGSPYFGRPEFDPAAQRTMVLDGVGGHVHPARRTLGFSRLGLSGAAACRARGASGLDGRNWRCRGEGCATSPTGAPYRRATATCGASIVPASSNSTARAANWIPAPAGPGTVTGITTRTSRRRSRTWSSAPRKLLPGQPKSIGELRESNVGPATTLKHYSKQVSQTGDVPQRTARNREAAPPKNLAQLLMESPFVGAELDLRDARTMPVRSIYQQRISAR